MIVSKGMASEGCLRFVATALGNYGTDEQCECVCVCVRSPRGQRIFVVDTI